MAVCAEITENECINYRGTRSLFQVDSLTAILLSDRYLKNDVGFRLVLTLVTLNDIERRDDRRRALSLRLR